MSETSPVLALPYIQPAQAQKHVTHNEALRTLDAVVQLVIIAADISDPPVAAQIGDRYVVGPGPSGAWVGHTAEIAVLGADGWFFVAPQPGWRAQVLIPKAEIVYDDVAGWELAGGGTVESTQLLGVNATADTTNRLSLSSTATLLNHEGAGHQLKLNKAATPDTASLLYQTGFSGRAEMGLAGNDDFSVKVSADGSAWNEALVVDGARGIVSTPQLPAFSVTSQNTWTEITTPHTNLSFEVATFNVGGHYDTSTNTFTAPVDGIYAFLINGFLGSTTNGRVTFAKNGVTLVSQMQVLVGAVPLSFTATIAMAAGDTVTCRTGNVNTLLRYYGVHTSFSGWLVS